MKLLQKLGSFCAASFRGAGIALLSALVTVSVFASEQAHSVEAPQISLQLWSVREQVEEDIDATLEAIAELGFDGVEFAGEFGPYQEDASALRDYLDSLGLKASGAHVGFDDLDEENFERTVAFYQVLGVDTLVVPLDERAWSDTAIDEFVKDLNALSRSLASHDMSLGYHNHQFEFREYQDTTYWDYMADHTTTDVQLQLDVGWVTFAGVEPATYLRRHADRITSVHFKPQIVQEAELEEALKDVEGGWQGEMQVVFGHTFSVLEEAQALSPVIGKDLVDWQSVLDAVWGSEAMEWIVVEQEVYPEGMSPLEAVEASMKGLQALLP